MADYNGTTHAEVAQKKEVRVFSYPLSKELFESEGMTVATGNILVAHLPANAVITDAYVSVKKISNAATTALVSLGTAKAGKQLLADANLKTLGVKGALVAKADTGSGTPLWLRVEFTGAVTDPGTAAVVLEYTEYELNSGEYTSFDKRKTV